MKIVYLSSYFFGERDYHRFNVQELINHGYEVEVWDCGRLINKKFISKDRASHEFVFEKVRIMHDMSELTNALSTSHRKTVLVVLFPLNWTTLNIYRLISQSPFPYGFLNQNAIPAVVKKRKMIKWVLQLVTSGFDRFLIEKAFHKAVYYLPHWFNVRKYDFVMVGGANSCNVLNLISQQTKILWAHTFDYDIFLKESDNQGFQGEDYIAYLDEYWPFHPDFPHLNVPSPITAERLYPKLVDFFNYVEQQLGCEVIIAAHPRSHYEDHPDYFAGRKVIKGQTAALVKNAKCVIGHDSTSLNFANLYNKPVIFVKFNMSQVYDGLVIVDTMASWFGKKAINLDEIGTPLDIDLKKELTIDRSAYAQYREAYIKRAQSPEKLVVEIFIDYLKELETRGAIH